MVSFPVEASNDALAYQLLWQVSRMSALNNNEYAMLELLALQPLSFIAPLYMPVIGQLLKRGLTMQRGAQWYPTATALKIVGRTLH